MELDLSRIRAEFKCLQRKIGGRSPVYVDSACMTLKPDAVIRSMTEFYENHPSCHNRSLHAFGRETTEEFRAARESIARHLHAKRAEEIVFTRNATEAINLVARSFRFRRGDVVVTSDLEHNSNHLPWQFLAQREGIVHKTFSIGLSEGPTSSKEKWLAEFEVLLRQGGVRLVSLFHTSHVTGVTLPIREMAALAHRYAAFVLVDAAQALPHHAIDVCALDVDFMALSFHKAFGPTGMGALYGKYDRLNELEPFLVGGETVLDADYETCVPAGLPERLEAGLQNYAGAIGSARGLDFISEIGLERVERHVVRLNHELTEALRGEKRLRLLGPENPAERGAIFNFHIDGVDSGELSVLLDKSYGIMARSGVHCSHAWYHKHGLQPSLRIAFSIYNDSNDVARIQKALKEISAFF